jgi:hypothetical protein
MPEYLRENLSRCEIGTRFLLGAVLLAATVFAGAMAIWVALLAIYPVMTAIMAWDPVYAAIRNRHWFEKTPSPHKISTPLAS